MCNSGFSPGFNDGVWHVVQVVSLIFTRNAHGAEIIYAQYAHAHSAEIINFYAERVRYGTARSRRRSREGLEGDGLGTR